MVVIMTTSGAACDDKADTMTIFAFQCIDMNPVPLRCVNIFKIGLIILPFHRQAFHDFQLIGLVIFWEFHLWESSWRYILFIKQLSHFGIMVYTNLKQWKIY